MTQKMERKSEYLHKIFIDSILFLFIILTI